jgi:hypothetical protein
MRREDACEQSCGFINWKVQKMSTNNFFLNDLKKSSFT